MFSGSNRLQRAVQPRKGSGARNIDHTHVVEIRSSFAGALSFSSIKSQVPREMRATFINIQKLETRAREQNHAAEYAQSIQWPLEVWVRENLSILSERDFTEAVARLVEEIDAYASSHSLTLLVENTIRVARNTASRNPSHRFDSKAL